MALCVATASASFIAALNHTSVARVLFILAVAPVLAALLARITLGEPITRRTVLAMALALAGVTLMLGAPGEGSLAGDGLSFIAALAFALMIVITRWRHDVSMTPATCLSQVILVVAFIPFASPAEITGDDVVWLAPLGIGQIGLGFALLTVGARLIPAAQVGLITLLEVVLGPIWVWLALDERPSTLTLIGGAIVIVAIVIQTRGRAGARAGRGAEYVLRRRTSAPARAPTSIAPATPAAPSPRRRRSTHARSCPREIEDADAEVPRTLVVADRELGDPELVSASDLPELELRGRRVVASPLAEVVDSDEALAGLWKLEHSVVVVHLVSPVGIAARSRSAARASP